LEFRWANGRYNELPALVADLLLRQVALIIAVPYPAAHAAKAATSTTPIVFSSGADPVKSGLVASLNRPGGNATGVSQFTLVLGAKRIELLRELVPQSGRVAILLNSANPNSRLESSEVEAAARTIGQQIDILSANTEGEIDNAFTGLAQRRAGALLVGAGSFFLGRRGQIVELAARYNIPTIYSWREFADAGGLVSYSTNLAEMYRHVGTYAGRILKGENPADLPVLQPTKFELVINLKTAKALGITVPPTLLARADEVIE
jgi:ABC-type uncharacterized transport system substrate-binding protein